MHKLSALCLAIPRLQVPLLSGLFLFSGLLTGGDGACQDLPPVGRSAFDHLLAMQPGSSKILSVPYPFDRLIRLVRSQVKSADKLPVSVLFIPFGRSLQRFAAEPDFFKFPRVVLAVNSKPEYSLKRLEMDFQNNLYIAYVEPSNMLEIISYNEKAARYEFQIVKNYQKGKQPEVYYAPRELCTTCHEGEMPLFPSEPWSETNDNDLLADEIVKARGSETYFGEPVRLKDMKGRIFSDEAQKFDFDILSSGKKQFAQRIVQMICNGSRAEIVACRAVGLKTAFAAQFNHWAGKNWHLLKEYSKLMDKFYKNNRELEVPFPFLPDRDPVNNAGVFGESSHGPVGKFPYKNMNKNLRQLAYNLRNLPKGHDPKNSRMHRTRMIREACSIPLKTAPIPYKKYCNTSYFLGVFSTEDTLFIRNLYTDGNQFSFERLSRAIDAMSRIALKSPDGALSSLHLQRNLLLRELIHLAAPGIPAPELCCQAEPESAPRLLPGGISPSGIFDPGLKKLMTFCVNCHGNPDIEYPLQFLYGKNEKEILSNISRHRSLLLDSVNSTTSPMPPERSKEIKSITRSIKKSLAEFISRSTFD